METLYTAEEIAEILKLHPDTVRDYLNEGRMQGYKVGNRWRVTEEQLTAFVKARYQR